MRQPNGIINIYQSGSWEQLSGPTNYLSPIAMPTKWVPYQSHIFVFWTFRSLTTLPFTISSISHLYSPTNLNTYRKLAEVTRTFNNSVMHCSAWIRDTNDDSYNPIVVTVDRPGTGSGFVRLKRFYIANPSKSSLYKEVSAATSTSQGLTTYTADLSSIASGTFSRLDFLFNSRYVYPWKRGYVSEPSSSYSSAMTYPLTSYDNGRISSDAFDNAGSGGFSGWIESIQTFPVPTMYNSSPTDPSPSSFWTPITAGPIAYNNLCLDYSVDGNPLTTYTQRYTETMALSIPISSHNYSQIM